MKSSAHGLASTYLGISALPKNDCKIGIHFTFPACYIRNGLHTAPFQETEMPHLRTLHFDSVHKPLLLNL